MKRWRTDGFAGRYRLTLALVAFAWALPATIRAEQPAVATSSFSSVGLERVSEYMRNEVATGKIPGAIVLIQ